MELVIAHFELADLTVRRGELHENFGLQNAGYRAGKKKGLGHEKGEKGEKELKKFGLGLLGSNDHINAALQVFYGREGDFLLCANFLELGPTVD
jgi:hypothetical protein